MRIAANLSLMFTEHPLPERFAAAKTAGFDGVEIQFPYDHPPERLAAAARAVGLPVVLINIPAGDAAAGDIGLGAIPSRQAEFRDGVALCLAYARALGVRQVNLLAGRPGPQADAEECRATLRENLRYAAAVFAPHGIRTLIEPVNGFDRPGFFLDRLAPALALLQEVGDPATGLQFDLYHMARSEPDLPAAIRLAAPFIGHVQFADAPGRHEPGSGSIDFAAALAVLRRTGYARWLAAEYIPAGRTEEGLGWLPVFRALLGAVC